MWFYFFLLIFPAEHIIWDWWALKEEMESVEEKEEYERGGGRKLFKGGVRASRLSSPLLHFYLLPFISKLFFYTLFIQQTFYLYLSWSTGSSPHYREDLRRGPVSRLIYLFGEIFY